MSMASPRHSPSPASGGSSSSGPESETEEPEEGEDKKTLETLFRDLERRESLREDEYSELVSRIGPGGSGDDRFRVWLERRLAKEPSNESGAAESESRESSSRTRKDRSPVAHELRRGENEEEQQFRMAMCNSIETALAEQAARGSQSPSHSGRDTAKPEDTLSTSATTAASASTQPAASSSSTTRIVYRTTGSGVSRIGLSLPIPRRRRTPQEAPVVARAVDTAKVWR